MDPVIIVGALALVGTGVTAYGAYAGKKSDRQGAFTDDLLQRVSDLESDMRELRSEFDAERGLRIRWENHAWDLNRSLKRGLDVLRKVAEWVSDGAQPPAPDVSRAINELEDVIDTFK